MDSYRRKDSVTLAILAVDIDYIKTALIRIEAEMKKDYVTKTEFNPVRLMVYGFAGLLLAGMVVFLFKLAVK